MAYFAIVSVTDTVLLIKPSICMSCVSGCSCDCHKHVHSEQSVLCQHVISMTLQHKLETVGITYVVWRLN